MRSIDVTPIIVGSKILFEEKGIPHTGYVKAIYENYYLVRDVTFLDYIMDREYEPEIESIEDMFPAWEVSKKNVIKTGEIFLPEFPDEVYKNYVSSVCHSCMKTPTELDLYKFMNLFPHKKLYSKLPYTNMKILHEDIFISFSNKWTIIKFKDDVSIAGFNENILYRAGIVYDPKYSSIITVIEAVSFGPDSDGRIKSVILPIWLDYWRVPSVTWCKEHDRSSLISNIKEKYPNIDVVVMDNLDESNIDHVYEINEYVYESLYNGDEVKFLQSVPTDYPERYIRKVADKLI